MNRVPWPIAVVLIVGGLIWHFVQVVTGQQSCWLNEKGNADPNTYEMKCEGDAASTYHVNRKTFEVLRQGKVVAKDVVVRQINVSRSPDGDGDEWIAAWHFYDRSPDMCWHVTQKKEAKPSDPKYAFRVHYVQTDCERPR